MLVVAAYLDTVVDGDPSRIPSTERGWIRAALTASDGDAVVAVRERIPGSPGAAITARARSIGDTSTVVRPTAARARCRGGPREQVRFMAALGGPGRSARGGSAFLLEQMRPIPQHRWGLGTIGASAFKGGWLTRRRDPADGHRRRYAVAIITVGQGPAVVQTDGDAAHVEQMNPLAAILAASACADAARPAGSGGVEGVAPGEGGHPAVARAVDGVGASRAWTIARVTQPAAASCSSTSRTGPGPGGRRSRA